MIWYTSLKCQIIKAFIQYLRRGFEKPSFHIIRFGYVSSIYLWSMLDNRTYIIFAMNIMQDFKLDFHFENIIYKLDQSSFGCIILYIQHFNMSLSKYPSE